MFDRISVRYDLLNHLLSLGQDIRWRKKLLGYIPDRDLTMLDIATGTGDQAIAAARSRANIRHITGIDLAKMMLKKGVAKVRRLNLSERIHLEEGDACALHYADNSYDLVTVSFGIRNVEKLETALAEMERVLKPGGMVLVLEFSIPENRIIRAIYLFYFRNILPLFGGMISGDKTAYRYLNETVETFPFGNDFCNFLERTGFEAVQSTPLTFGVATIYRGKKRRNAFDTNGSDRSGI